LRELIVIAGLARPLAASPPEGFHLKNQRLLALLTVPRILERRA
jgi:hypothetical protein